MIMFTCRLIYMCRGCRNEVISIGVAMKIDRKTAFHSYRRLMPF